MSLSRRRKHHSTQTPAFCITTINSLPFPTSIKVPHLPHRHSLFIPPWRDLEEHSTYESIRVRTARGGRFVLLACDAGSPLKVTLGQDIIAGSNDLGLDSGQRAWDAGLRHFSTVPDFLSSDGYAISIIEHHKRGPRGPGRLRIPHSWISATGDLQWLMVEVVKRLRRGNGRVMITVIRRHREREPDPLGRPRQISVDAYRRLREYEITHPQIVDDEYLDFAIRVAKSSSERLFLGRIAAKNVVETFTFTEQSMGLSLPGAYFDDFAVPTDEAWLSCIIWDRGWKYRVVIDDLSFRWVKWDDRLEESARTEVLVHHTIGSLDGDR